MNFRLRRRMLKSCPPAFTLVEMMVSTAVLAMLLALIGQLLDSAMSVTIQGGKHMDGDAQARAVFDRMEIDFSQIVKRSDVDFFLKDASSNPEGSPSAPANDQLAFYSQVPGYNASTTSTTQQSPVSLVAYRINANSGSPNFNQLERLGYGLAWNGSGAATDLPVVFASTPTSFSPNTISNNWPQATATGTAMGADGYEEMIGPDVFRMEYYYTLRGQTIPYGTTLSTFPSSTSPNQLSATPWYTAPLPAGMTAHTSVNGLQDVAAITVVIAVIDPKSRVLVSNTQLSTLAGKLTDFSSGMNPGDLENAWKNAISATGGITIPKIAAASIRVYRHDFYLPQTNPNP